jgi:hypothetical protein
VPGGRVEPVLIAAGHDHHVAALLELPGQFEADTAGSAGDQNGLICEFHGSSWRLCLLPAF